MSQAAPVSSSILAECCIIALSESRGILPAEVVAKSAAGDQKLVFSI